MANDKVVNGSNGSNRLSTTISILAMVVAIGVALFRPLSSSVDTLRLDMTAHENLHGHSGVIADISEIREKFVGFDRDIANLRGVRDKEIASLMERIDKLEERWIEHIQSDAAFTAELRARILNCEKELERLR